MVKVVKKRHPPRKQPKQVDWILAERLATIGCSFSEIAYVLQTDEQTIRGFDRKSGRPSLRMYRHNELKRCVELGRLKGKLSLRRAQWVSAMRGNKTMLLWLGKHWLGQQWKGTNSIQLPNTMSLPTKIPIASLTTDELATLKRLLTRKLEIPKEALAP